MTRLQEVFTDHGGSTRPVTEVNLPQQNTGGSAYPTAPGVLPHTVPTPPVGQIHSTAELRNVYPEQHHPTLVPNMTAVSQHADIYHQSQSRRAREKRPQYRDAHEHPNPRYHNEYLEEYHPRVRSVSFRFDIHHRSVLMIPNRAAVLPAARWNQLMNTITLLASW